MIERKENTILTLREIRNYRPPAVDKIITAKTNDLISLINTRFFPALFKQFGILFYSHCTIYIPLSFFTKKYKVTGWTGLFYDAFVDFLEKKLIPVFLKEKLEVELVTSKDFYWFGWFDVVKEHLSIFILLNQPIILTPYIEATITHWLRFYFEDECISLRDFLVVIPKEITTLGDFLFINTNIKFLSNNGFTRVIHKFFIERVFDGNLVRASNFGFFLIGNIITKYCMRYSILDAYARHSLEDFENVEQLFEFYQKAGIRKKTFTNIPQMPSDFFFEDIKTIRTFKESKEFRLEYNMWYGPNGVLFRGPQKVPYNFPFQMSPFFSWHIRKELCFGGEDVRSLQQLYTDIHNLNFMGDYYHLYYNYRKLRSLQQLLELRVPLLGGESSLNPLPLPNYGYRLEDFTNKGTVDEGEPTFDQKCADFYSEMTSSRYRSIYNPRTSAQTIVWSPSLDFLENQHLFFGPYDRERMDYRHLKEIYNQNVLCYHFTVTLPQIFLHKCKQGNFYLPLDAWVKYKNQNNN